ncbi:MAG: ATP synthase subunit a [candidate division BRC1 bacterium ADurb.BinA292]|nr:MAG: ATP synthase subunit a [candidate division BRC1 bacterium ADurb.BinA292]
MSPRTSMHLADGGAIMLAQLGTGEPHGEVTHGPGPHGDEQQFHGAGGEQPLAGAHAAEAHAEAADGGEHHPPAQYLLPHEVPNIATLAEAVADPAHFEIHGSHRPHPAAYVGWVPINFLFSICLAGCLVLFFRRALRPRAVRRPGRLQLFAEMMLGGMRGFIIDIMGEEQGRRHFPYLASLWFFILVNNLAVLAPGLKAPTASLKTTLALGLTSIVYVRTATLRDIGPLGYVYHLAGSPKDVITWCMAPLFIVIELIGEVVKPVSLSLRLFGATLGEDKVLAAFLGIGMMITAALLSDATPLVGLPLHVIFFPVVILLSTIQATVFAVLSAVYIMMMQHHEEHEEGHGHEPAPATEGGRREAAAGAAGLAH